MINAEMSNIVGFLRGVAGFDQLPDDLLATVATAIEITYHRIDTPLFWPDDNESFVAIVRAGAVETFSSNDTLLARIGEGDFFGPLQLVNHHGCHHARMLEDTLLYRLSAPAFQKLLDKAPALQKLFCAGKHRELPLLLQERVDTLELTARIAGIIKRTPVTANTDDSLVSAARLMNREKISSLLILEGHQLAGILTDRDMRSRVVGGGLRGDSPCREAMTADPITIDNNDFVFDALLTMARHNIHHLPVLDGGRLAGIITLSDIARRQSSHPVYLISEICKADNREQLATTCERLPALFVRLVEAGARASEIYRIVTAVSDSLTRRLLELAELKLGKPPVAYTWLAFGSQGREEHTINSDQDNGLLLHDDYEESEHGHYFSTLADFVCDGLHRCGFRYCPGDIMATTRQWRQPLRRWLIQFNRWINEPESKAVMFSSIFFDLRAVAGDRHLFDELQGEVLKRSQVNRIFLAHMARNALSHRPPLGFFRNFVVESSGEHKDELDLKHRGTIPITDLARLHALANGIEAVHTLERLQELAKLKFLHPGDTANLVDAHEFIAAVRLRRQVVEIRAGENPDNFVAPDQLSRLDRHHLKEVFQVIKQSQELVPNQFLGGIAG